MRQFNTIIVALVGVLCFFAFENTASALTHTWCVKWSTAPLDAGVGEDWGTNSPGTWKGRGARVRFQNGSSDFTGWLDEDTGCSTWTHSSAGPWNVTVYAEARVGVNDDITVRAFSSEAKFDTWNANKTASNLQSWVFNNVYANCTGNTCNTSLQTPNATGKLSNLMGYATWQTMKLDSNTSPPLSGQHQMILIADPCLGSSGSGSGSCQEGDLLWIQDADAGARRKFLVGHEIGHWFHAKHIGDNSLIANGLDPYSDLGAGPCTSDGVPGAHALRSREYQLGAYLEGFAHFLSALAYNDHTQTTGWFRYYKDWSSWYDFDTVDLEATSSNPAGGANDWLHASSGCQCLGGGCSSRGTEIDWLRFFWDYRTNANPGSKPTHRQIFDHAALTRQTYGEYSLTNVHDHLEATVQSSHATRWDNHADHNGADPTPE